jgi:hypothetical protein
VSNWDIRFRGGFIWVFQGNALVTVGVVAAQPQVPPTDLQHHMVLRVPINSIDSVYTTLTGETVGVQKDFELLGDISVRPGGTLIPSGDIKRTLTGAPSSTDDFYFIFSFARVSSQPPLKGTWRNGAPSRFDLTNGTLMVTTDTELTKFQLKNNAGLDTTRFLATDIVYIPNTADATFVDFVADGGQVRVNITASTTFDIRAACACESLPIPKGDPMPGFVDIFDLFAEVSAAQRVVLHTTQDSDSALRTPGPRCPSIDLNA